MTSTVKPPLPPGPRSILPWRVFKELRRDPLAFLTKLTATYGDVSSFSAMGQRYVVLNHPDLAREVLLTQAEAFWKGPALQNSKGILGDALLTAEGDAHKRQRRLVQPAFHAKHVEGYAGDVIRATRELIGRWGSGEVVRDIRPEMMGLTLVIAGTTLFGAMLADEIATVHRCMDDLMNNYRRAVVPWGKLLNRLPLPTTLKLARAQSDLRNMVQRMIDARRAEIAAGGGRRDLLSMMIGATDADEDGDEGAKCPVTGHGGGGGGVAGVRFTDEQLRDQAITILTAAHETTANAMTFTLYLLAKNPEEQRLLFEEVAGVLGAGEEPTLEMLERLPRTRWVLSESMRLLPPAWTLGRQNRRPIELGGFFIPDRTTILIPQWTLHRDARFWKEPLAFSPERWREPAHPRYAYLPFSTGPRNCIGESFASLEMMLALPLLVRGFEFSMPAGASGEMRLTPAITLRPRDAVKVMVRAR